MSLRTKAVLEVLRRGGHAKLAATVQKVFGASSIEECFSTYEQIGRAERASIDEMVERVTKDAGAAFELSVENRMR
jgi:hypothetical protein